MSPVMKKLLSVITSVAVLLISLIIPAQTVKAAVVSKTAQEILDSILIGYNLGNDR